MRLLTTILALNFLVACQSSEAPSTTKGNINSEAPYIWSDNSFPKSLRISSSFSAGEITKIKDMGDAWADGLGLSNSEYFFNYGAPETEKTNTITNVNSFADNIYGVYRATRWPYPDYPDALAVTQIFGIRYNRGSSTEHVAIQEADIIVNFETFKFDDPDPFVYDYDLQTVVLHEMGHFLGLQHKSRSSNRDSSVMYPSIYSYETKKVPKNVDVNDLANKYGITLGPGANQAISTAPDVYSPNPGDTGEKIKIILELRANGECVHHVDGVESLRHPATIK